MSSYEFDTHEPVDLYVELGKGDIIVTASDTTATTVEVEGRESERVDVHQDGRQISVIGPKGNRGLFGGEPQYVVTIKLPTRSNAVVKSGSADVQIDGTKTLMEVTFSSYIVQTGPGTMAADWRKNCKLTLNLGYDEGFQCVVLSPPVACP